MCQKADPLVSGTVGKLVNKAIHLLCVFFTYTKRRPRYSSTKYATTVDFHLFYLAPYVCTICTRICDILTLINKKTQIQF